MQIRAFTAFLLSIPLGLIGFAASAQGKRAVPEIWFAPKQSEVNPNGRGIVFNRHDFSSMVSSDQGWKQAASRISALHLNAVGIVEAYPDVPSVIAMIGRNKFRISSGGSVVYTDHRCEVHTEGVTNDDGFEREFVLQMRHWEKVGGRLDYLSMDSPLVFGYYVTQKQCHFSIEDVARRAATSVNMVLEDFPNAVIVDAEGPAWLLPSAWLPDYERFVKAFDAASRKPIVYLNLDMHWTDSWHTGYNWVNATRQIANFAHAHGLKIGLIMDADDRYVESPDGSVITSKPMTNDLWMQQVRGHMQLAHDAGLPLDVISINSWMRFPERDLPESDLNAFTSLVDFAYELWSR